MKVSPVLVEKWYQEWEKARIAVSTKNRGVYSPGTHQQRVERFLTVMGPEIASQLKNELLEILLAETAETQETASQPLSAIPL